MRLTPPPPLDASYSSARRAVLLPLAAALLASPLTPSPARAGVFGPDGPQDDFLVLADADYRLGEITRGLRSKDGVCDVPCVLQTATIYVKRSPASMAAAAAAMPKLGQDEARAAQSAVARYTDGVAALLAATEPREQLAASEAAGAALTDFLDAARSQYTLPAPTGQKLREQYSSDPNKFASQYFGFLSCEGNGLERLPGSNSCANKEDAKLWRGKVRFDKDLLTGKPRPGPASEAEQRND